MSALSATTEQDVQAAIAQASAVTDVPVSVLDFIHQHEVNIAKEGPGQGTLVNAQGYGGFFGLPASDLAGGDPEAQAQTVGNLLKSYGLPSWQEAIDEYNTGNPSKGYGGQYLGSGSPPAGTAATSASGTGITQPAAQDVSLTGSVLGVGGDILLRIVFVLGGVAFGVLAFVLIVRAFTGISVPKAAVGAVAVVEGRKELQQARQRRAVSEQRAAESHASKIELQRARVKTEGARATELRTRTRHRAAQAKRSRAQQEAHDKRMMVEGAIASEQARGRGRMGGE